MYYLDCVQVQRATKEPHAPGQDGPHNIRINTLGTLRSRIPKEDELCWKRDRLYEAKDQRMRVAT